MEPDFSEVSGEGTRGNGYKLKRKKFLLNTRKNFSAVRVVKYWNRSPRDV